MVIEPRAHLLDLNLKEVWKYRDLLMLFVKRDFIAQYKQTILGPLWHIIQPVFTTVMFLLVFGKIANIPTDGIHPVLFYMSGITIWNYFSNCLTATSTTFVANAGIFGKVYFPRLVIPLSTVLSNIVKFGIQFLVLLAVMIFYSFRGTSIHFGFYLVVDPGIDIDDGRAWAWIRNNYFFFNHQVPGPYCINWFCGTIINVCNPHCLPAFIS